MAEEREEILVEQSRERVQTMLDAMPMCCNYWDKDFNNIECNQEAVKLFGLKDKQEYLDRFFELSPERQPDGSLSSEKAKEMITKAFGQGKAVFEWMHRNLKGDPIPAEITLVRVKDDKGPAVVGYTRDLRQEKANQERMREADERIKIMFDATPLCCNYWDDKFNNIDCNQEAVNLFDLKNKQEYLDRFFELSPERQPDGRLSSEKAGEMITKAFKEGKAVFEWMHRKLNGDPMPSEISLIRVRRDDKYIVAGYTRDLREIKAAQAELDKERLMLREVLDSSPVCFAIVAGGVVTFIAPFIKDFLGIDVGSRISDFFADEAEGANLLAELEKNGDVNWQPITMKSAGDSRKEMLAKMFYTGSVKGKKAYMLWLTDVTEIRKVELDLRSARDIAESSAKAKSEFLANMSHEIRTPMNAILGMLHLLLKTQVDNKQRDYVEKAEQSAKSLLRIINDILDFSKIEAGKLDMENAKFSVRGVIDDVHNVVSRAMANKKVSFKLEVGDDVPDALLGDQLRLNQIILNLVNNAVKFTENGDITVKIINEAIDERHIKLMFSVCDTGIGMSPGQVNVLFAPFTQVDNSITRKYGGTGLGLAISRSLVEMMGGEIWCESELKKGSCFHFTAWFDLPSGNEESVENAAPAAVEEVKQQQAPAEDKPVEDDGGGLKNGDLKILLVDDNPINRMLALELLKIDGYTADEAENGRIAVEKVVAGDYDLVLMDIQMPEMDGLTATKKIREIPKFKDLAIIAMTAHAMTGDKEMSLKSGMDDHITKPIMPPVLYATLAKWADVVRKKKKSR